MAQRKRTSRTEDDYEQDLEWLVEETAKLKFDLASLVLTIPRAIIALARCEAAGPSGPAKDDPPPPKTQPPRGRKR